MESTPMSTAAAVVDPVRAPALHPDEVTFYKDEGYLLLPNLLDPAAVAALREETLAILQAEQRDLAKAKLVQSNRYLIGSRTDGLVNSPVLRELVGQLLEGPSSLYFPFTAVKSARAGGRFDFHQDNQYTRHDGPSLNMWFALEEMTPANGCLVIEPRSHLQGTLEAGTSADGDGHRRVLTDPVRRYLVRMRPGDCVAFSRLTVHGSGPNTTPDHRVGYAVQFHRDDTRALIDGEWRLLKSHPRFESGAVTAL
jgi:phytanoyl-CoA hydroxylase